MTSNEYEKAFNKSFDELSNSVQRRDILNAEIAGLRETVRVLSNRVTLSENERSAVAKLLAMVDYATPNLTDSIRALLTKFHPKELTAIEVRNALEESSFNFDEFSNSLSACHAALKRLLADEKVAAGVMRDGKPTYKAVLPTIATPYTMADLLTKDWAESVGSIVEKMGADAAALDGSLRGAAARMLDAEQQKKKK